MSKWAVTRIEDIDEVTKTYKVLYEPCPDYVDLVRNGSCVIIVREVPGGRRAISAVQCTRV